MRKFFLISAAVLAVLALVSCSAKKDIRPEGEFDPEKSLNKAVELIDSKDFEDARKLLLEVKNRDVTKKYAPVAQLKTADSYAKEDEYSVAIEEYKRFIEMYPEHKYASYAQLQIAMNYFVQIESPERGYGAAARALEEFEKLKRIYPRNPYKELIEIRIGRCKSIIADYEYLVGEFYFKKDSYNAALGRFQSLILRFPDYNKEPGALYYIAVSYKRLGNMDKAREYLSRLLGKYPDDSFAVQAKKEFAQGR